MRIMRTELAPAARNAMSPTSVLDRRYLTKHCNCGKNITPTPATSRAPMTVQMNIGQLTRRGCGPAGAETDGTGGDGGSLPAGLGRTRRSSGGRYAVGTFSAEVGAMLSVLTVPNPANCCSIPSMSMATCSRSAMCVLRSSLYGRWWNSLVSNSMSRSSAAISLVRASYCRWSSSSFNCRCFLLRDVDMLASPCRVIQLDYPAIAPHSFPLPTNPPPATPPPATAGSRPPNARRFVPTCTDALSM